MAITSKTFVSKVLRTSGIDRSVAGCVCIYPLVIVCESKHSPRGLVGGCRKKKKQNADDAFQYMQCYSRIVGENFQLLSIQFRCSFVTLFDAIGICHVEGQCTYILIS
jgi:hypothetical protein